MNSFSTRTRAGPLPTPEGQGVLGKSARALAKAPFPVPPPPKSLILHWQAHRFLLLTYHFPLLPPRSLSTVRLIPAHAQHTFIP